MIVLHEAMIVKELYFFILLKSLLGIWVPPMMRSYARHAKTVQSVPG